MTQAEAVNLMLAVAFGIVSMIGVALQIWDLVQRRARTPGSSPRAPTEADTWILPTAPSNPSANLLAPRAPPAVFSARILLLLMAILMVPNVGIYVFGSVTAGTSRSSSTSAGPMFWVATALVVLVTGIPLAAILTVGSFLVERGRNWARVTIAVLLGAEGILCGCFGTLFPSLEFSPESRPSSPMTLYGIAFSTLVMAGMSIAVVILLFLPQSNAYFKATATYRAENGRTSAPHASRVKPATIWDDTTR